MARSSKKAAMNRTLSTLEFSVLAVLKTGATYE